MIVDHTKIGAAFRRLSLPVAMQMLGDQLLGTVDTIAIGSLGTVALAGATAANTILLAIVFAASGFSAARRSSPRSASAPATSTASRGRCARARVVPLLVGVVCFAASLFSRGARRSTG